MSSPDSKDGERRRPRFQFTLGTLFLVTALVSVLAAALGGMWRAHLGELSLPAHYFLIMAVAAPMGTMIVLSLARAAAGWIARRRTNRKRRKRGPEAGPGGPPCAPGA